MNNVSFTRLLFLSLVLCALSGCGSEGETTESTGVDTSPATGTPGGPPSSTLQFSANSLVVTEGANATITITRTGGSAGSATVTVSSRTGTASSQDYTSVQTTVTFTAGDTAKTFTVATTADDLDEPNETFFVTLSNATGAGLGSPAEMIVTIEDDDFSAPAQPVAAISASYKQLLINWTGGSGATHYQLLKSTDGGINFVQVGGNLPVTQSSIELDIVVHKEQWDSAYAIAACNPGGCTRSEALSIANFQPILTGYLKSQDPTESARFGQSVALSADGTTLAVGSLRDDSAGIDGNPIDDCDADEPVNCNPATGGVHIYTRTGNQWTFQAYLKPADLEIGDRFGHSVALSGDGNTLVASAPFASPREVFVFSRTNNAWGAYVRLANPGGDFDDFGSALALSNDGRTLAVGAPYAENDQLESVGAVYVFANASGTWSQAAKLRAPHTRQYMAFGNAVALAADGGTLVVGAPWEDGGSRGIGGPQAPDCETATPVNCAYGSGAAYVFTRENDSWSAAPDYIKSPNSRDGDGFALSVSLSHDGRLLIIGAPSEDDTGGDPDADCGLAQCIYDTGAAYAYYRSSEGWSDALQLLPEAPLEYGYFGNAVSLSGDGSVLIVAAMLDGMGVATSYTRLGDANWRYLTSIEPSNRVLPDDFGGYNEPTIALSADGNVLAIGAPREAGMSPGFNGNQSNDCVSDEPTNCAAGSGAVYLYF